MTTIQVTLKMVGELEPSRCLVTTEMIVFDRTGDARFLGFSFVTRPPVVFDVDPRYLVIQRPIADEKGELRGNRQERRGW